MRVVERNPEHRGGKNYFKILSNTMINASFVTSYVISYFFSFTFISTYDKVKSWGAEIAENGISIIIHIWAHNDTLVRHLLFFLPT